MKIATKEEEKKSKVIRNVSVTSWNELRDLAKVNGVTLGKMLEMIIEEITLQQPHSD